MKTLTHKKTGNTIDIAGEVPTSEELSLLIMDEIDSDMKSVLFEEHRETEKIHSEYASSDEGKILTYEEIVKYSIMDFLDSVDFEKNDMSDMRDLGYQFADDQTDIYNYQLYKKAYIFSDYIEDVLNEDCYDKKQGFIGLLQAGQNRFYNDFACAVCDEIENIEGFDFGYNSEK